MLEKAFNKNAAITLNQDKPRLEADIKKKINKSVFIFLGINGASTREENVFARGPMSEESVFVCACNMN